MPYVPFVPLVANFPLLLASRSTSGGGLHVLGDACAHLFDSGSVCGFRIFFEVGVQSVEHILPLLLPHIYIGEHEPRGARFFIEIMGFFECGFRFFKE